MKRLLLILCIIIFLGTFLRFYRLGEIPSSIHRDEAFLGYNAYSLLKTAKDMNGVFLPLHLQSFLYSPAGYSYFSIPFIALFGLSAFSVRFASALFGSLTILAVFFLVYVLIKEEKHKKLLALLSSFFLAISPWHINVSRTATESSLVVFFVAIGVILYMLSIKRNVVFLIFSFLSFFTTLFLYQAPRAFLPFFIPLLIYIFYSQKRKAKTLLIPLVLFITTIIAPLVFVLSSESLGLRIRTVSIFSTSFTQLTIDEKIREDGVSLVQVFVSRLFHNKVQGYSSQFLENYFKHFSYDFLFTDKGLPDRYRVPLVGLLYVAELPLLIAGGIWLFLRRRKEFLFLLAWIGMVPIGSALTFDDIPNLQRTFLVFPALSIIIAYGALGLIKSEGIINGIWKAMLGILLLGGFLFYLHAYYVHSRLYRPWYRQDGYEKLVNRVVALKDDYKKVVITNHESAPAIFFLFFTAFDPLDFQKSLGDTNFVGDLDRRSFAQYEFSQEECPIRSIKKKGAMGSTTGEKDILYVNGGSCKIPKGTQLLKEIHRADGSLAFSIVRLQ